MTAKRISSIVLTAVLALAAVPARAQARIIYSESANPSADIAQALHTAALQHKHVIVDFGGNWCGDCQVLDIYFHQQPNLDLLEKNYELVHVDIGHFDKNLDVVQKYDIPIKHGVPLLMVLDARGRVLFIQKNREFEKMQVVTPAAVTDFLNQWRPKR